MSTYLAGTAPVKRRIVSSWRRSRTTFTEQSYLWGKENPGGIAQWRRSGKLQTRPQADGRRWAGAGDLAQERAYDGIRSQSGFLSQSVQVGFQGRPAEPYVGVGFHLCTDGRGLAIPVYLHQPVQSACGWLGRKQHHRPTLGHSRLSECRGESASGATAGDPYG